MKSPEMQERLASIGAESVVSSPQDFAKYIAEDVPRWGAVSKALNLKVE